MENQMEHGVETVLLEEILGAPLLGTPLVYKAFKSVMRCLLTSLSLTATRVTSAPKVLVLRTEQLQLPTHTCTKTSATK